MKRWLSTNVKWISDRYRDCSWQMLTYLQHFFADAVELWLVYAVMVNTNLSRKWSSPIIWGVLGGRRHEWYKLMLASFFMVRWKWPWRQAYFKHIMGNVFMLCRRVSRECRQTLIWLINILRIALCSKNLFWMPSKLIWLIVWRSSDVIGNLIMWNFFAKFSNQTGNKSSWKTL